VLLKDYSEEQIKNLIEIIKNCVRENRYIISLEDNKLENIQFMQEYNINEKKRINILFNLYYKDFCYGLKNLKDGFEENNLYIFCVQRELYNIEDKKELVDIYLKFNIICNEAEEYRILVSLHKRNKPITYVFK
jgi:UDP-N-acetylglucosamine 2-epimerase